MSLQRTGKALIDGSHDQDQIDSDVNFENEEFYENITEEDDSMPDGTELYATETTVVIDSGEVKIKFFVYVGVFWFCIESVFYGNLLLLIFILNWQLI